MSSSDDDREFNAKRARDISDQEKIELRDKLMRQEQSVDHCTHVLKTVRPSLWPLPQFKQVQGCIHVLKTNPYQYSPVIGDSLPDGLDHPIGMSLRQNIFAEIYL
jgi:hypothetical protein